MERFEVTFLICTALVLSLHLADEVSACAYAMLLIIFLTRCTPFNCQPLEGYLTIFGMLLDLFDLAAVIQTLQHHMGVQEPLLSLQ